MWKRFIEWCQVLSLIVAVLAIVTANSSSTALSNTLSFIPGLITRNSGILAWVFGYLSFGLWAWLRFRAYDHVFYKKPPGDASDGENKNQKVVADTWFQHATFYVAFGKWPDPSKPVFKLPNSQVPTEENIELLDTLKDMHQKAFDGELSVWGKRPMTVTSLAVPNALFKPIPKEEWDKHRVEYMDLINPDEPSRVHTSIDFVQINNAWCELKVSRAQVEGLWPIKQKTWPNFSKWDAIDIFKLYEAAALWHDQEPSLPLSSRATLIFNRLRRGIYNQEISPYMELREAVTSAVTQHSGDKFSLDDAVTVDTQVKRAELIKYAKKHEERPKFLFPGARA
ncbi:MAG: hypothetical protein ACLP02_01940 [Rhodomicrobium sp.]